MKIDMNKDFETEFQNTVWSGLTSREILIGGIALSLALGVGFLIWYFSGIPINVCVYFGLPVMAVIVGLGMIKYQGSSPWKLLKEIWYTQQVKELAYEAEEYSEKNVRVFSMKSQRMNRKAGRKKGGKKHGSV